MCVPPGWSTETAWLGTNAVVAMATPYTAGIERNHPFSDGNKRNLL